MGSIVHRSVPTNLKWFPTCSHAHAMFQDRFKDVQVGSRWFSTLHILSPNFHSLYFSDDCARRTDRIPNKTRGAAVEAAMEKTEKILHT